MQLPKDPRSLMQRGFTQIVVLILLLAVLLGVSVYLLKPKTPNLPTETLSLSIDSPREGTLLVDGEVLVKGKTSPGALVVFFTETDENSVEADGAGNFQGSVALSEGINTLVVTAFAEDGQEKTTSLEVVNDSESG